MSKVSCEAAGKHRRCGFANGAAELCVEPDAYQNRAVGRETGRDFVLFGWGFC